MMAGKKVENFQRKWVFMEASSLHARLELPEKLDWWGDEKLTDPLVRPLLKKMEADLKAEKLTGAMIVKEFPTQRLPPL